MSRPRLLDLMCGAGGAGKGYDEAGFEVVGVDIKPMPRYPFEFHQADAMTFPLSGFDAIAASPPCQMYSRALKHLSAPQPMLIDAMRERLIANGAPWIIENVEGSPLPTSSTLFGQHGVMLCGTAFGMRSYRHRLFETSFPVHGPGCAHQRPALNPHNAKARELIYEEFGRGDPEKVWRRDMGVEWMSRYEAREAIPPAFTRFLGAQLMNHLGWEVAA
jgi:DNA (cytosine-5)-methyltransferase 1